MKLQLRVLIPAVENVVAGNAIKPKDILTSRKGLTVEVTATAEHGPARTAMGPSQLQPSNEPRLHLVMLRSFFARDLAAASAEVARLEAAVASVQDELRALRTRPLIGDLGARDAEVLVFDLAA